MLIYTNIKGISRVEDSGTFNYFCFKFFSRTEFLYDLPNILDIYTPKWPGEQNSWVIMKRK